MSGDRYNLVIAPSARRQLAEQLPESVAFAAYEFIVGPLLANPRRVGKQLRPPLGDRHSARRGTYRVLYRIDDGPRTVTVLGVFPRSDAYRNDRTLPDARPAVEQATAAALAASSYSVGGAGAHAAEAL